MHFIPATCEESITPSGPGHDFLILLPCQGFETPAEESGCVCFVIGSAFRQQDLKRTLRVALRLSLSSVIAGVHHTNFCRLDGGGNKSQLGGEELSLFNFFVRFYLTEINNSCCPLQRLRAWLYVLGGSASCNRFFLPVSAAPVCSKALTGWNLLTSISSQFDVCFPIRAMTDC